VALDLACYVAVAPNKDGKLRLFSKNMKQRREFALAGLKDLKSRGDWTDYVAGVAVQLAKSGFQVRPLDLYIESTVPQGGGLSSSASLEVSTALALLGDWEMEKVDLAKLARSAEVEFVGMPCGIMDQYISVFGQENAALKIDCRSLGFKVVKLPADIDIVAVNTMVKHELGGSAYRERVAECGAAVAAIQTKYRKVQSLRDAKLTQLSLVSDTVARMRARHAISESERVTEFVAASKRRDCWEMGRLFVASHRSLQHDYEVSCEELDFLVDTAVDMPYVYGCRMTGGGFGGCTVNMMKPGTSERFQEEIAKAYKAKFGIDAVFYPVKPSAGAGRIA
jgi:galactokinase